MVESKSQFNEDTVGISLFLGDVAPKSLHAFNKLYCTIKHRFSDFIVNEIDQNGDVVWFQAETNLQKWKKCNQEPSN
jgi:hypothetical protein